MPVLDRAREYVEEKQLGANFRLVIPEYARRRLRLPPDAVFDVWIDPDEGSIILIPKAERERVTSDAG